MPLPIDMLLVPVTAEQANEKMLDVLETIGLPARSWRKGGALRTLIRGASITIAGWSTLGAQLVKSRFRETAEGDWLWQSAINDYGFTPDEATFAAGSQRFVNTGGGVFSYDEGAVRVYNPDTGKVYVTTAALSLPAFGTVDVPIQAVEVGSASSSGPGEIRELETTMLGVTTTNPAAVVGNDKASDDDIKATMLDKLAALSIDGPRGAYGYAVRTAKRLDGSPVDINRFRVSTGSSAGTVRVWCASPSGTPVSSDLDRVRESIEAIARPDTVKVIVSAAATKPLSTTITVWARRTPGLTEDALKALVTSQLLLFVRDYPIGGIAKPPSLQGYLYAGSIDGVCKLAHPSVFDVDGATDLALNGGEVAVLTSALTVRFVDA